MGKRDLIELQGTVITHNRVGACEVLEILHSQTGKAKVRIVDTNEVKTFVISTQFFSGIDDFNTPRVMKTPVKKTKHIHRKVDLDKYRNHPLVKQIDQQERKRRKSIVTDIPVVDADEDETDEIAY